MTNVNVNDKQNMDAVQRQAETAFIRARVHLMNNKPFWAHLVLKMPLRWMQFDQPGGEAGVSCTDGENLFINPVTFVTLPKDEQVSVLIHEVLHCAAGHLFRRGVREPVKWNIAGDVYIANTIEAEGFTPIAGAEAFLKSMRINRNHFASNCTEHIYDHIPDPPKQSGGGGQGQGKQGKSSKGCGGSHWNGAGCYKPANDVAKQSELDQKWRNAVIEASQLAGDEPGAWQELVKAAMPKPPFHLKLYEYLNRGMGGDTSWESLNRRFIYRGVYLPTSTRLVMGRVAWVNDTSGSMGQEQLKLAFGYGRAFREQHPCQFDLIECDCGVAAHKTYEEHEPLPETFNVSGRGGTSFNAPFEMLREKRIDPAVVIYVTDGFGTCDTKAPSCPTLWVVVGDNHEFKGPFGETVYAND